MGEIAFLREGTKEVRFGRGQDELMFVRQRPGSITLRPPLVGDGLSREQLLLRAGEDALELERIGRCPTSVNGEAVDRARLRPGDVVLLRDNLLFFVVSRPRALPAIPELAFADVPPFGAIDRFGVIGESPGAWALRATAARDGDVGSARDGFADRREDLPLLLRHVLLEWAEDEPERLAAFRAESGEIRLDGGLILHLLRDPALERAHQVERFVADAIQRSEGGSISHRVDARLASAGPRSETVPPVEPSREELRAALAVGFALLADALGRRAIEGVGHDRVSR